MLSFAVYSNGRPAEKVNLSGAYVVGSDDVPLRAEIAFKNGIITCKKRAGGPAGLAILWDVPGFGAVLTETARLQERAKPYVLMVELARGRLTRLNHKIEEWGLFDYSGTESQLARVAKARRYLTKALQADSPAEASAIAEKALAEGLRASEELSEFHADIFFTRRRQANGFPRRVFGCLVNLDKPTETTRKRLASAFDFITLPVTWRDIEPNEQTFNWKPLDAWVEMLSKHRVVLKGAPLLSFNRENIPEWLYVWEQDFNTIRDLAFEHMRRVMNRYGQHIQAWSVVSGIHGDSCFAFSFEQLMELTRMAAAVAKQTAPNSLAIIDLVAPWGEYYARNQRTIPPLLYADMVVQSGVNFDAFGLQFHFGPAADGMFVRDMFQISALLDSFAKLGKPLHISALQVPSDVVPVRSAGGDGPEIAVDGGCWHEPWSEEIQSDWLREFLVVALSKPFVESVTWRNLADHEDQIVPHGGLLRSDLVPKEAYHQITKLRSELLASMRRAERGPAS